MGCAGSSAVVRFLGRAGCIQQWPGYKLLSLPRHSGRTDLQGQPRLCLWSWFKPTCSPSSLEEWCYWPFSAGDQLCLTYSECCWAVQLPGGLATISDQAGPGAVVSSECSYTCLGEVKLGSSNSFKDLNQICILSSLVRLYHHLGSSDQQRHRLGLLLGCYR